MQATIDISEYDLTSVTLTNDEGEVISWEDLSRDEQLWLLDSFKTFHKLFSKFIKEENAKSNNKRQPQHRQDKPISHRKTGEMPR